MGVNGTLLFSSPHYVHVAIEGRVSQRVYMMMGVR